MNNSLSLSFGRVQTRQTLSGLLVLSWATSCIALPFECGVSIALPPIAHSNLVSHFGELARRTYPLADKVWVGGVIADRFQAANCRFRAYGNRCVSSEWWLNAKDGLKIGLKTYWDETSGLAMVGSGVPLPGEPTLADREKPLTIDEGKPIAEAVFERLRGLMTLGQNMKFGGQSAPDLSLPYSEDRNVWIYSWGASDKLGFGASVQITVRARDGRVVEVRLQPSWQELIGDPKLTREQTLEKAKALPGRIDEKNLSLSIRCYYAERRLVWQYMPPPNPSAGVLERDYGVWDAMTGDLLESDRLNGAKPEYNTYRNPEFFFEPTEANVKANLEKNLRKWAEELEAKAAKAPEAKPHEGK